MTNPSRDNGTRMESRAARYLRGAGWPDCDRQPLRGNRDHGDLIVSRRPLIIAEVKYRDRSASQQQVAAWMDETLREADHAGADLGVLIVARKGVQVESWHACMTAADWVALLVGADLGVDPGEMDAPWVLSAPLADWAYMAGLWADR